MRIAVYILVFVNIAFFAWAAWIDAPRAAMPTPAESNLPRLVLASEADAELEKQGKLSGSAGTAAARCLSVGPFHSAEIAGGAMQVMRQRGLEPQDRTAEGEVFDGYWVYVGGLKSDADEQRVMRTLMQASLTDARVMPQTAEGRRISVGLFSERIRAERRARALQRLGLEPQIGERTTSAEVYWVDVQLKAGEPDFVTEGLLGPTESADGGALERRPCPAGR